MLEAAFVSMNDTEIETTGIMNYELIQVLEASVTCIAPGISELRHQSHDLTTLL